MQDVVRKGADPNIRNNKGLRALDYAISGIGFELFPVLAKSVNETDYIKRVEYPIIMEKLLLNLNINLLTPEDFDYAYKKFPEIKKSVEAKLSSQKKIEVLKKYDPYEFSQIFIQISTIICVINLMHRIKIFFLFTQNHRK